MKRSRKSQSSSPHDISKARVPSAEGGNRKGGKATPAAPDAGRKNPKGNLPPNENIRKHPDEVYGDTEIPERKQGA
jgi:hypothetical protein